VVDRFPALHKLPGGPLGHGSLRPSFSGFCNPPAGFPGRIMPSSMIRLRRVFRRSRTLRIIPEKS
jgi:hypothetical protein